MPKRPKGFPNELSKRIKWTGPTLDELRWLNCPEGEAPHTLTGDSRLYPEGRETEFEEKKADIRRRRDQAHFQAFTEAFEKLLVLCRHYKIDTSDATIWPLLLSLRLAIDFFPGFDIEFEQKRGRKETWSATRYQALVYAIEAIKEERNCGDSEACRYFLQRRDRKPPSESSVKTLAARLSEARNPTHNVFAELAQHLPELSQTDAWHDAVKRAVADAGEK